VSAAEAFHEFVAHRAVNVGEVHDLRGHVAAADPKQHAGRAGLQEYVQALQVSAHTHEGRRLLQTGDEGAVRASRLLTGHARDLDAMILAACVEAGVEIFYSEDVPGFDDFQGLQIVNPFK